MQWKKEQSASITALTVDMDLRYRILYLFYLMILFLQYCYSFNDDIII